MGGGAKVQGERKPQGRLPLPGHRIPVLQKSTNFPSRTRGTKFWLGTWSNTALVWSFCKQGLL